MYREIYIRLTSSCQKPCNLLALIGSFYKENLWSNFSSFLVFFFFLGGGETVGLYEQLKKSRLIILILRCNTSTTVLQMVQVHWIFFFFFWRNKYIESWLTYIANIWVFFLERVGKFHTKVWLKKQKLSCK